jgi:hypothetical protein
VEGRDRVEIGQRKPMRQYDAILIPGGGVRDKGELPPWTKKRLDLAIKINDCDYFITLSAGTTHKSPPLDDEGYPIFESVAAAHYLISHGISSDRVLAETSSYDTIGNIFFSKVIHVDPLQLKNLLFITSAFHMARTEAICRWIYGLEESSQKYVLEFASVSDEDIELEILEARRTKEKSSLENLLKTAQGIRSTKEFHQWLFNHHNAYAFSKEMTRDTGHILETY